MHADITFIKGLWEVHTPKGAMLVRARNRRLAAEVALNSIYDGHPEYERIRETVDHESGNYHATFDVVNWGMAKTQVAITVRRPEVFII